MMAKQPHVILDGIDLGETSIGTEAPAIGDRIKVLFRNQDVEAVVTKITNRPEEVTSTVECETPDFIRLTGETSTLPGT